MFKRFHSSKTRSEIMVQMSASEVFPNLVKIIFAVSFFHHLSKHPMKPNIILKWWATWTFLPQQFLKYNAHSLSSFKSNCISKSRVCKNNLCMKERCSLLRRRREGGGSNLVAFHKKKKTNKKPTTKPHLWERQVKKWLHKV